MKLLIIGIDGFSYRMVEKTKNKYMSELIKNSQYGISISDTKYTSIPHTGPNWACIYTGVEPDVHGITEKGWKLDNKMYCDIKVNTIFDLIDKYYIQSLMTMPLTFPAFKINGWMISGFPTPKSLENCYFPKEIKNKINKNFVICYDKWVEGKVPWSIIEDKKEKIKLKNIFYNLAKNHLKTFKDIYLENPTEVVFIGFTYLDRINHLFTQQDVELKEAYFEIYEIIKELIDFNKPKNIIICSDHGFEKDKRRHDKYGFYLIKNELFIKGRKDITITDIAPSVLRILNITEELGQSSIQKKINLNKIQEKEMKEKLKALGYI